MIETNMPLLAELALLTIPIDYKHIAPNGAENNGAENGFSKQLLTL